jgi:predicted metal-dependent hydrolase
MSNRPRVKELMHSLITKLSYEVTSAKKYVMIENNFERKWSDVVAGRRQSEQTLQYTQLSIITS